MTFDRQRWAELERTLTELRNAKRQCELVKSLLADATAEKEIMYEVRAEKDLACLLQKGAKQTGQAFNEELDGMYNDAHLPEDEAWTALSDDLRRTKEARNALSKENS